MFDFEKPSSRDFTETVRTLTHLLFTAGLERIYSVFQDAIAMQPCLLGLFQLPEYRPISIVE